MVAKILITMFTFFSVSELAFAQMVVIGNSETSTCYEAVIGDQAGSKHTIRECREALLYPKITRRNKAATYVNIGVLQTRAGDYEGSLVSFDEALNIYPTLADIYLNQGASFFHLARYQDSIDASSRALELGTSKRARALVNRAMAYEGLGRHKLAYQDLKSAISFKPDWPVARQAIKNYKVVPKTS